MRTLYSIIKITWKLFGSAKFAIGILSIFAVAMIIGTVLESRFGTAYAAKKVYFAGWFFFIQLLILISLIVAVIDRLPFRKKLTGFYTVHAAIVIIILGSIVTRVLGLDGQLVVKKDMESKYVKVNEDILYVQSKDQLVEIDFNKSSLGQSNILYDNSNFRIIKKDYIPYAKSEIIWVPSEDSWGSDWIIKNDQMAEKITLTYPGNQFFSQSAELGPLKIAIISYKDFQEILQPPANEIQVTFKGKLFKLDVKKTRHKVKINQKEYFDVDKVNQQKSGLTFYEIRYQNQIYKFFPKFSIYPIKEHLEVNQQSPFTLKKTSEMMVYGKTQVLISKDQEDIIYCAFQKEKGWVVFKANQQPISLPWMGLEINLLKNKAGLKPVLKYQQGVAHKESEKNIQALNIQVLDKRSNEEQSIWVSDQVKEDLIFKTNQFKVFISAKMVELPFSVKLDEFRMETNPGTMEAASYESFVVSDNKKFHIYMNNPMKLQGYTLYQSSYYQNESGEFESVLSVNKDPGRWIKYIGSLLLVIGLIIHYLVVYKRLFYA